MSFFAADLKKRPTSELLAMFVSNRSFISALNATAEAVILYDHPDAEAVHLAAMRELSREIDRRIPVPT